MTDLTVVDAVNEFEALWPAYRKMINFRNGIWRPSKNHTYYSICNEEEFNQAVADMETNYGTSETLENYKANYEMINDDMSVASPNFTQEMADNGELPSVGMTVISEGVKKIVRLPKDANNRFLLESVYMGIYALALYEGISAINPPIELINGKAYQFDYVDYKGLHGLFCKKTNTLCFDSGHPDVSKCTNIQPLALEVK